MRAAWLLCVLAACAPRARPYRFASPMLAAADADPSAPTPAAPRAPVPAVPAPARPPPASVPLAAQPVGAVRLPAPHRGPLPPPELRVPADLRGLVGVRDRSAPITTALAWQAAVTGAPAFDAVSGPGLLAAADAAGLRAPATAAAAPGDLLVFDRTEGDAPADLVGVVIARDARGVTEFLYVAGRVVRRGFVDAARPALRRDAAGAVVNTYLRAGGRWPPAGTRYLAGELLAAVIHAPRR